MSRSRTCHSQCGPSLSGCRSSFNRNYSTTITNNFNNYNSNGNCIRYCNNFHDHSRMFKENNDHVNYVKHDAAPSLKRRKFSASTWEDGERHCHPKAYDDVSYTCGNHLFLPAPSRPDANAYTSTPSKCHRPKFEDDDVIFMSRDEIERCSPSRKNGIDGLHEKQLRYSYCAFLQNLGLPQSTIGTAMVLCHRFFVRSHACHDRFLIATAALFLAAKSEETPCPLNYVLRASCEIFHKQDFGVISCLLPVDWFEHYRERVVEAEQLILTTLDFELIVQHPYGPLTSILDKLGLSQSVLVNLALNLISEWVYTRLACWPV